MVDEHEMPDERSIAEGIGERVITGEYKLVPAKEVSPNQKQSGIGWLKIAAAVGATFGAVQAFNSLGPCQTGWKFQTIEAASIEARNNSEEHVAIRENITMLRDDVASIKGSVSRIEKKLGTKR